MALGWVEFRLVWGLWRGLRVTSVEVTLGNTPEWCSGRLMPVVTQCDRNSVTIFPFPHLQIYEKVCLFLRAAVTNELKLGGLKTTDTYLSQLWRPDV